MPTEIVSKIALPKSTPEGTLAFAAAALLMLVISAVVLLRPDALPMFDIHPQADSQDL